MRGQAPWPAPERSGRFREFVDLLDRLLRVPATSLHGHYYTAYEARTYPGCVQQPRVPFAIDATDARGMRVAADYGDMWVATGNGHRVESPDVAERILLVREQLMRLDEACHAAGRDPSTLDRLVVSGARFGAGLTSVEEFRDTVGRYAELGVTDYVVYWPRPTAPFEGDADVFEHVISSALR
jgi:alkanesulfonate monooxygenase SsuD/methylene tetrahydromethanopterin reductase-like flavin-dependent oxidoreductase (luciferase family)